LRLFESEVALQKTLDSFLTECGPHLGLVSVDAPLISNLSVSNNIALIRQYHENLSRPEARAWAVHLLDRFGLATIADQRTSSLNREQLYHVMLIRAAMVRDAVIVLDRPFRLLPDLRDGSFFTETLRKMDDLIAAAHVFDYTWEKERYEEADGAAD
jgi:ABC-type nitrate/sulfonate/bicarbonate transport system ATPase subunit